MQNIIFISYICTKKHEENISAYEKNNCTSCVGYDG